MAGDSEASVSTADINMSPNNKDKELKWPMVDRRCQFSAVVALSVVDIALLKTTIDTGPSALFYYFNLAAITLAIILQFVSGGISMWNAMVISHYKKHTEHITVGKHVCCPWKCVRKNKVKPADNKPPEYEYSSFSCCSCGSNGFSEQVDLKTIMETANKHMKAVQIMSYVILGIHVLIMVFMLSV